MAVPLALIAVSSLALARRSGAFRTLATLQVAFYAIGALGLALHGTRVARSKVFSLAAYLCVVNAASLVALRNLLTGRRIDRWEPARETNVGGLPPALGPGRRRLAFGRCETGERRRHRSSSR